MFKNMTIGRRLIIGFGSILVIILALSLYSNMIFSEIAADVTGIGTDQEEADLMNELENKVLSMQELFNDAALTGNKKSLQEAETGYQETKKLISQLHEKKLLTSAQNLDKDLEEYYQTGMRLVAAFEKGREAGLLVNEEFDKDASTLKKDVSDVVSKKHDEDSASIKEVIQNTVDANRINTVAAAAALLLGIAATVLITKSVNSELRRVSDDLAEGAEQVASASKQLSGSSQSLSQGASEQASSIEETSASLEEISSMVKQNADNAGQANQLSLVARQTAEKGADSVDRMIKSMDEINKSSTEVSKIIRVINDIAFQTNLLALNAAVEAARAGDHGRGFAVVAEEVRNLARRSAEAAKETSSLIESSVIKAEDGSKQAVETGSVLKEIVSNSKKIEDLVREIAAASKEQADGLNQVTVAMTQMDQVTQSISANSEESASSSEELSAQAEGLRGMVETLVRIVGGSRGSAISVASGRHHVRTEVRHADVRHILHHEEGAKGHAGATGNGGKKGEVRHDLYQKAAAGGKMPEGKHPLEEGFKEF